MKEIKRTDLLNHLIEKHKLVTYLEIGVQNPNINFDLINTRYKIGVDPDPNAHATFCKTSDEFFNIWEPVRTVDVTTKDSEKPEFLPSDQRFDLIFIDGLHTAEQVKKDFENALKILSPNGFIVLHDCNPEKEEHTIVPRPTERGHWNGDVWKFAVAFYGYHEIDRVTVNEDNGCFVFRNNQDWTKVNFGISEMSWNEFDRNREKYLNLISWQEFIKL